MGTVQDVLDVASSQIGYSRWDDPEQGTKYGRWFADLIGAPYYAENGVPYCAMFVSWVFAHAGVSCAGLPSAYCPAMLDDAEREGRTVAIASAKAGDVVYFEWNGDGETDHVGIVTDNDGSCLSTIEGNTSAGSSGSQANGGVVAARQRSFANVCGIVRPYYGESGGGGTTGQGLEVDGVLGPLSVSEWQRQCGTSVDGMVAGQLEEYYHLWPALVATDNYDGSGSDLMREVQRKVGVSPATGIIAKGTISHLQGWLNLRGYDTGSDTSGMLQEGTAKAVQRSLNDGAWRE